MGPKRVAASGGHSSHSTSKTQSQTSQLTFVTEIFDKLKGTSFEERYIQMQKMLTVEKKFDPDSLVSKMCLIRLSIEHDMPLGTTSKEKVNAIAGDAELQQELARVLSYGVEKQGNEFLKALRENPEGEKFGERGPLGTLDDVTQMLSGDVVMKMVGSAMKKMSNIDRILLLFDLIILRIDLSSKLTSLFSKTVSALGKDDYRKVAYERILARILLLQLYHFDSNSSKCWMSKCFDKETAQTVARLIVLAVGNEIRDNIRNINLGDFLEYTGILMCRLLEIAQDPVYMKEDLRTEREKWLAEGNGSPTLLLSKLCIEPNDSMGEDRLSWSILGIILHIHAIYGMADNILGLHLPNLFGTNVRLPHYGDKLASLEMDDVMITKILERIGGPKMMLNFGQLLHLSAEFDFSLKIIDEFINDSNEFTDDTSKCRLLFLKIYALLGTKNYKEAIKFSITLLKQMPLEWIDTVKSSRHVEILEMQNVFAIERSDGFPLGIVLLQFALLEYVKNMNFQPNQTAIYLLTFCEEIRQKFTKNWAPDVNGVIRRIQGTENLKIVSLFLDYARSAHFCKTLSASESLSDEERMKLAIKSRTRVTPSHQIHLLHHLLSHHPEITEILTNPSNQVNIGELSEEGIRQFKDIITWIETRPDSGRSTPAVQVAEDEENSRGGMTSSTRRSKTPMFFDIAMNDEMMEIDSSSSNETNRGNPFQTEPFLSAKATWDKSFNEYHALKQLYGKGSDFDEWSDDDMRDYAKGLFEQEVKVGSKKWLSKIQVQDE